MLKIAGFQKLTLLDYPEHMACTVFTKGCNFRCPFCHNARLVISNKDESETEPNEIISFLKKRQGILEGVCITGGEPTLMSGLEEFIFEIKELGYAVKLDTNGTNPAMLKRLVEKKLVNYVAMDIKNCKEKYNITAGVKDDFDISPIIESAEFLMSGEVDFEFRTTVVEELHRLEDFEDIGKWLGGNEKFFLQKFVDSGNLIGAGFSAFSDDKMREALNKLKPFVPNAQLRGI